MQEEINREAGEFTIEDWIAATPDIFDNHERFQAEVLPIIQQLEAKCKELGSPFALRVVVSQDAHGNSSNMGSWLGGANRATPEILLINSLQQFSPEFVAQLSDLLGICQRKFVKGDGIIMPDLNDPGALEAELKKLFGGGRDE